MKTGLEDKRKVAVLGGLALVAAYFFYANVLAPQGAPPASGRTAAARASEESPANVAAHPAVAAPAGEAVPGPRAAARAARPAERNRSEEFHPVLHSKNPEEQIDPNTVDPRIRLDLLAKLQNVAPAGSGRNLFQVGPPPPLKPIGPEPKIVVAKPVPGPPDVFHEQPAVMAQGPPPLPPITFKYYGLTTVRPNGKRTAFFMSGEEILIRAVGDMVAGSYRLVSIGQTSAVVEDTQSKRQQTVPLAEEAQG
ncbi:MAG: hypothetical protein ACLQKA_02370 [Bryobacteraceae bacterium]